MNIPGTGKESPLPAEYEQKNWTFEHKKKISVSTKVKKIFYFSITTAVLLFDNCYFLDS